MKFGQLVEYNKNEFLNFSSKIMQKSGKETSSRFIFCFSKKIWGKSNRPVA